MTPDSTPLLPSTGAHTLILVSFYNTVTALKALTGLSSHNLVENQDITSFSLLFFNKVNYIYRLYIPTLMFKSLVKYL